MIKEIKSICKKSMKTTTSEVEFIEQLVFDIIKQQTKQLWKPVQSDELRIDVSHRLM